MESLTISCDQFSAGKLTFDSMRRSIMSVKYHLHEAHDLQHRVNFVLKNCPYLVRRDIQCEIIDQDVVLKGSVRTYYEKQMAQEALRKVTGVRSVLNELTVFAR